MSRAIKIALWLGAVILGAGIAAKTFGISLPFGNTQTVKEYMREVVDQGTLGEFAKQVAAQYAKKHIQGFDAARFQRDMNACLHQRVETWLQGNDPRLAKEITHDEVKDLAGEFTSACVADLADEIK